MNLKRKNINLKNLNIFTACTSMIVFILIWWGVVLMPTSIPYADTFKRIGLTILLVLLTKYFDKDLKIKLSEMYRNFDFKNFVYSLIGIFAYMYIGSCIMSKKICFLDFSYRDLEGYISLFFLVLFEEMFFRGWGYNAFWSVFDKKSKNQKEIKIFNKFKIAKSELKAIIFTNFFFALIHLQTYITILHYSFLQTLEGCISVFFIGTFFTLIFRKTKSIWNAMTIHFFWDYIINLIVK